MLCGLVLVSNDFPLIGNGDFHHCVIFQNDALTTTPRHNARVDGAVDKIFLRIRNFFQKIFPTVIL